MKSWWQSFTVRLVVASIAWTAGLLYFAHVLFIWVMLGAAEIARFGPMMAVTMGVAFALMACGALIVRGGLRSFTVLRHRLLAVHEGRERNVTGQFVNEIEPVVATLNGLLAHQDRRLRDALARAGDLAHGLKTPLAILSHEADRAADEGHDELAGRLTQQVQRMQRQIDYHLAHARAAASGATPGACCAIAPSAEGIARTLLRLHAARGVSITTAVAPQHAVRVQREDLDEILGNLVDNACKWAASRVAIAACERDGHVVVTVDDDGPGLAEAMWDEVFRRGVRADEAAPGSGLGLAIVRDLVELYGGAVLLEASPLGGLRARVELPAVQGGFSHTQA